MPNAVTKRHAAERALLVVVTRAVSLASQSRHASAYPCAKRVGSGVRWG